MKDETHRLMYICTLLIIGSVCLSTSFIILMMVEPPMFFAGVWLVLSVACCVAARLLMENSDEKGHS